MTVAPTWNGLTLAGGRYAVHSQLGTGGMGLVYLAHDQHLDCDVVIKTPRPEVFTGSAIARFTREIRSLVRLIHPHIVKILDVGEHEGLPFVVLQYLSGGNLRQRQKLSRDSTPAPMPLETLCDWLEHVADTLDFIHEQGYVHRDVKPDNILFDPHGHPYLADFGVAKLLAADESGYTVTNVTSAGAMVGTPYYMAPELVQGQTFDGRADQYALAVMVHELLAGKVPFDATFRAAILMAHTSTEPPLLSDVVSAVPLPLALAVRQALAKNPDERYPDCRSFAGAVLEAVSEVGAGRLRIPVPGWWFARPENDPAAEWWEVGETPATVTLSPNEVYWLLARDGVTDQQLASLSRLGPLPCLRSLGLSFLRHLTDAGLAHLRGLTSLESLSLTNCARVTDAGLAHLSGLVWLQSLALDETQVSDAGLTLLQSFPHLRTLILGQCKQVSDTGLSHVAERTTLQKLLLAGCTGITDAGMTHLPELIDLRTLDLAYTSVGDAGLTHLHSLSRLEYLSLVGLEGVTNAGLSHLQMLSGLRKLFLGSCHGVSDSGLSLLRPLKELEFLALDGTSITDAGLQQLVELTTLQGLDVRRCGGVSAAGVEAFRVAVPGCRVSGPV